MADELRQPETHSGEPTVRIAPVDAGLFPASIECRYRNLYQPFGLGKSCAISELDSPIDRPDVLHRVAFVGDAMAATGRVDLQLAHPQGPSSQLRYCAVEAAFRGKGVGQALLEAFESEARDRGVVRMWMEARVAAVNFYQRMGYTDIGEGPLKWGIIPHRVLEKQIQ